MELLINCHKQAKNCKRVVHPLKKPTNGWERVVHPLYQLLVRYVGFGIYTTYHRSNCLLLQLNSAFFQLATNVSAYKIGAAISHTFLDVSCFPR